MKIFEEIVKFMAPYVIILWVITISFLGIMYCVDLIPKFVGKYTLGIETALIITLLAIFLHFSMYLIPFILIYYLKNEKNK
jgi:hypothetical protein